MYLSEMEYAAFGLFGLFLVSFLAATLLPLASEGVLLYFLIIGFDPWMCLLLATMGNTLGGTTNYFLGKIGHPDNLKKRLGSAERFERFANYAKRYGFWLGLLSWLPFIGDPLVLILGYFRTPFWPLVITMTLSKGIRYAVIIFLWNQ